MAPSLFQVRNKYREVEGTFSKAIVIERIASGRYTGDEEVAQEPFERWQKLSSHPAFYDAFLKRLYADDYHAPDNAGATSATPAKKSGGTVRRDVSNDGATRQNEHTKTRAIHPIEDDAGKTRRLDSPKDFNATIHQSDIDALFNDKDQITLKGEPDHEAGLGTKVLKLEPGNADGTIALAVPVNGPLDINDEIEADEPPPTVDKKASGARRRRIWMGSAVALLLVMLYSMGGGPEKPTRDTKSEVDRSVLATSTPREERVATLLDEADSLSRNDTPLFYGGALEVLREARLVDDSNVQILGRFAQVGARYLPASSDPAKLTEEIMTALQRGRAIDPHFTMFYRAEALVALAQGKLDEAKLFALNAAESDPTSGDNYLVVGELHYAAKDPTQARAVLEDAVKVAKDNVRARYLLAQVAADQNDLAKARAEGLESLKLNPLHPPTYLLLADIASSLNETKEARGLYETCGRLARFATRDVAGKAYERLGRLHEAAGNAAEATASYRLAYHYLPVKDAVLEQKVKGLDLKKETLAQMAREAEYQAPYFQEQGEGLLAQGKLGEAVRFFQAAQLLEPTDAMRLIRLGEVTEKTAGSYDDFRRVMSLYQRAIERDPKEAMGYIKLGTLETEQYNLDRGYKLLMQAIALAPDSAESFVALGKHYYKRQDYNEALNQFLKAAKINPSDSEILYYAGLLRLLFKKEGMKDALRFFYQAYTLNPQNYDALVEWLKLKVVNYEKNFAIKFVRNLIEAEPENAQLQWALGEVYSANKEYRRAITYYHRSLDFDNRASKVRMSLARALEAVGELDKAVAEFRLASLLDRRNSDGFYRAADLLFQMKNYNQAEEVIKFLIKVTPNYPGAHRYLSKIHEVRKQKNEAIAEMLKEVSNNPENYKFVIELAELYMSYQMFTEAALELSKVTNLPSLAKAPEFVYDKIRGYLLLARCYRAQNKLDSAEGAIRLALEIDANDPELHRELGYVYYAQQRDKEGVKEFQFYIDKNPAAKDVEELKTLIQKMMIEE